MDGAGDAQVELREERGPRVGQGRGQAERGAHEEAERGGEQIAAGEPLRLVFHRPILQPFLGQVPVVPT